MVCCCTASGGDTSSTVLPPPLTDTVVSDSSSTVTESSREPDVTTDAHRPLTLPFSPHPCRPARPLTDRDTTTVSRPADCASASDAALQTVDKITSAAEAVASGRLNAGLGMCSCVSLGRCYHIG